MATLTYGDFNVDSTTLPAVTIDRMLQTAINHILGNEVASQVVGAIRAAVAGSNGKASDVTTEQVKAYRANESHAAQITEWETKFRNEKLDAMRDGTLTVRSGGSGVSRDPLESAKRAIAKMEIVAILAKSGAKFPGKDATVTLADKAYDADTLIGNRLAHAEHGPRITKEAERKVAADKRMRDNAAKAAGDGDVAAELGLYA